jgi:hypothetical protein
MPISPVWIAWTAPACIALLVGVVDMEDVMLPDIIVVEAAIEEAPLKATGPAVVAVGLMETAVLLGFRTL